MKQKTLLAIAFAILILPFLGIPESWKTVLFTLLSLILAYTASSREIKFFFMPRLHHDNIAADAFLEVERSPKANTFSKVA